jgi:hypothetical protein
LFWSGCTDGAGKLEAALSPCVQASLRSFLHPRLSRSPPACPRTGRLRRFAPCRPVRPQAGTNDSRVREPAERLLRDFWLWWRGGGLALSYQLSVKTKRAAFGRSDLFWSGCADGAGKLEAALSPLVQTSLRSFLHQRLSRSPPACPQTGRLRRFAPCRPVRPGNKSNTARSYSARNACMGLILVARLAGSHAAARVMTTTAATAVVIAVGSSGLSW